MICKAHVADINAALRYEGLGHLLGPASSEAYMKRVIDFLLSGRPSTSETFDPFLLSCATIIMMVRSYLEKPVESGCELCELIRCCPCDGAGCVFRKLPWITASVVRKEATKLGIELRPTKAGLKTHGDCDRDLN